MEHFKKNRALSFITVTLVYILATLIGIVTYRALAFEWWLSLLIADVIATIVVFIFSLIFDNASVYDPYWSVQPPIILVALGIGRRPTLLGVLLLIAVFFWAIRLTANWAYTFHGLNHQDWRYTELKAKTGFFYPLVNFAGIHMVPTLIVYGCLLPAAHALINGTEADTISVIFIVSSLLAVCLQGIADMQMHKYRKIRSSTFIRTGLWKHSRHPNYLGEILMWWGIALAVVSSTPGAWYLASGALANTVLFLTVSIPLADGRQSRKDGFSEYKEQTRMLLPIKKHF